MLSLIARRTTGSRARCSQQSAAKFLCSTILNHAKPYQFRHQLPTSYAYSLLRFDYASSFCDTLPSLATTAGNYDDDYHRAGRARYPLPSPAAFAASLAVASAAAFTTESKPSICQGDDIPPEESQRRDQNASNTTGHQQQQDESQQQPATGGRRPAPHAWVRQSLRGLPHLQPWLELMDEVGIYFPAKGTHKPIGVSAKTQYTDWVMRFVEWYNATYATGQPHPSHFKIPPGVKLAGEHEASANNPLSSHLVMLPTPSLRLILEFLDAKFIVQKGKQTPEYTAVRYCFLITVSLRIRAAKILNSLLIEHMMPCSPVGDQPGQGSSGFGPTGPRQPRSIWVSSMGSQFPTMYAWYWSTTGSLCPHVRKAKKVRHT